MQTKPHHANYSSNPDGEKQLPDPVGVDTGKTSFTSLSEICSAWSRTTIVKLEDHSLITNFLQERARVKFRFELVPYPRNHLGYQQACLICLQIPGAP